MMLPSTQFHKPETWMSLLNLIILSFSASKNQVFPVLSTTSQIQPLFTLPTDTTLVQATGVSNLDYCTILPRCSPPVVKSPVTQSVL